MLPERNLVLLIFVSNHVKTLSKDKINNPVFMYRMSKTTAWGDFLFKGVCPISGLTIIMSSGFILCYIIQKGLHFYFFISFYTLHFPGTDLGYFIVLFRWLIHGKRGLDRCVKLVDTMDLSTCNTGLSLLFARIPQMSQQQHPPRSESQFNVIIKISLCPSIVLWG